MQFTFKTLTHMLLCSVIAVIMPSLVFAEEPDLRSTVNIPYSIVQAWQSKSKMTFPKSIDNFSRQQIQTLQYYLQTRGYDIDASGEFDSYTQEALSIHQGDDATALSKSTIKNINDLLAFLYCPVGQNDADALDFRLYNVNKKRILPSSYIPNNLELESKNIIPSEGPICLETETFDALRRMYEAAKDDGVPLFVTSSYRSEDSQDYLLQVMVRRMGNSAYRIVALPGQSEHNLGTAVDFAGYEGGQRVPLASSKQIKWLENNAAEFGFVNSYPVGKEAVTGFNPEPWHWRYVGIPIATTVESNEITLAEFFDQYSDILTRQVHTYGDNARLWLKEVVIGG